VIDELRQLVALSLGGSLGRINALVRQICGRVLTLPPTPCGTTASLAIPAGANVKVVQRILGATAAASLDLYGRLRDDDLGGVADAGHAHGAVAQLVRAADS
jgi:hypothetical protein